MKTISQKYLTLAIVSLMVLAIYPSSSNGQQNGIAVAKPKVFDNRSLVIMMENLNESLRGIQFIDQKSLAAMFNLLQGSSTRETVSSLSITPLPIPGLKQETTASSGNATSTGTALPDTLKQVTTQDRPVFTPQLPGLDTLPAFTGNTPTFGENPSDLLSDQVNLTYQIFNLRMLLERSLSDRLLSAGETRRQAVLGFNVSIDPPRTAEEAVAVVEITLNLTNNTGTTDGLSLVGLMPQEKTYNASALSTKSNSFGGAAVAKLFQVGFNQRQRGQTFYLYRDADTISYQRMDPNNPDQLIFGWMFRPVLGRKSISPGMRQLFAIVSLPAADVPGAVTPLAANPQVLSASVKSYWKKYDPGTMTSFDENDATRRSKFLYGISFNLAKPEIFSKKYINTATYSNIEVKSTDNYQAKLQPEVDKVWWVPVGPKSILLSINGNNFFNGTQVTIGDRIYTSAAEGLIVKSNQSMDLTLNLDALTTSSAAIIGRYGSAIPLSMGTSAGSAGISIPDGASLGPSLSGLRKLEIPITSQNNGPLFLTDLPTTLAPFNERLTPILTINGKVISPPYEISQDIQSACPSPLPTPLPAILPAGCKPRLILQTLISDSTLSDGGAVVRISWPFQSDKWTASTRIYEPASAFRIIRLASNRLVFSAMDDRGFTSLPGGAITCWKLLVGAAPVDLKSSTCLGGAGTPYSDNTVDITLPADAPDKIVLISPENAAFLLDVPKLTAPETPAPKPIELKQFDSIWQDIAVSDFSKVAFVEADKNKLRFRGKKPDKPADPVKFIQVEITREITQAPGDVDLIVYDASGSPLSKNRIHIVCQICDSGGK